MEIPLLFSGQNLLLPLGIGRMAVTKSSSGALPVASMLLNKDSSVVSKSTHLYSREGIPSCPYVSFVCLRAVESSSAENGDVMIGSSGLETSMLSILMLSAGL